jgi:hypothetical protein
MNEKRYKIVLALALFFAIICILGLPFTNWGFRTNDWANIYHSIIKKWSDIVRFFTENIEDTDKPSNFIASSPAFFATLYRPLTAFYYYVQYCLWGTDPYGYFLVMIGLHAVCSVLLFLLFSSITTLSWSFFCAALFAFHPSLYNWMGWISAQYYIIEAVVFLCILLSLHRYFSTQKIRWYLFAALLFTINIFTKESPIIFPVWLIFALHFYHTFNVPANQKSPFFTSLPKYLKQASIFWLITAGYLSVRVSLFPITHNTKTLTFELTLASFLNRLKERTFDFVTYGVDLLGLSWLPEGTMVIKITLGLGLLFLIGYFFYVNTRKSLLVFFLFSIALFSWPALLLHYQRRYIYIALLFIPMFLVIMNYLAAS